MFNHLQYHIPTTHIFWTIIILAVAAVLGTAAFGVSIVLQAPELEPYTPPDYGPVVLDSRGEEIGRLLEEEPFYVTLGDIPQHVQDAVIATEDRRFRSHRGVDVLSIGRAVVRNILAGRIVEGASTISQQLARTLYLGRERTIRRKLTEIVLAVQLERRYSKDEILEMYLNEVYFGSGAHGIGAASRRYFDKDPNELSIEQGAVLAGVLSAPVYRNPLTNPAGARAQRDRVITTMRDLGYLTDSRAALALRSELTLRDRTVHDEPGRAFLSHIRDELSESLGPERLHSNDLVIHTTLDLERQRAAEQSVAASLEEGVIPTVDSEDEPIDSLQPQLALVSIDSTTGAVRAMIGGRGNDAFNRAVHARRQPGSAWKPFVYSAAFTERNYHPGTVVNDMPMRFPFESGPNQQTSNENEPVTVWPRNFANRYYGTMSLRAALARSQNVPAVRLAREVGVESMYEHTQRFGFTTFGEEDGHEEHYSFPLGGLQHGVTPLQMASAYGVFANHGLRAEPYSIERIEDGDGEVLFEAERTVTRELSEAHAYVMRDMLQSAVDYGTGARAALPTTPVAGKTGTTNLNTDGWFIGFADEVVTSIWVGEDRAVPMYYTYDDESEAYQRSRDGGEFEVLGVHASEIWRDYHVRTEDALSDRRELDSELYSTVAARLALQSGTWGTRGLERSGLAESVFSRLRGLDWDHRPKGITEIDVDPETGIVANLLPTLGTEDRVREISETHDRFDILTQLPSEHVSHALRSFINLEGSVSDSARDIAILRGPAELRLGGEDGVETLEGIPFEGVYFVEDGEPVQLLDSELHLPVDSEGVYFAPYVEIPTTAD